MTTTIEPIPGPMPLTDEWFEARFTGIFASEAGRACNVSDSGQALDVYCEKCRLVPPFEGNEYTRRGRRVEPIIIEEYVEQTGAEVETGLPMFFSGTHRHIGATPDGRRKDNPKHLVEAKLCHWKRAAKLGDPGSDFIFEDWLMQAQQQMAVMNADVCDVMVMLDPHRFQLHSVHRNDQLIEALIETETKLWERILARDPPPPIFDKPGALDSVRKLFGVGKGRVTLSPEEAALAREFADVKDQIKQLEERKEELQAKLLYAIGDHECGLFPRGTRELAKVVVKDSLWTTTDVDVAIKKKGTVKRKGHVRLMERDVK